MKISKNTNNYKKQAFVLIAALMMVSAIALLVIAYFSLVRSETISARSYSKDHRAQLAALAGFEEAKGIIAKLTNNDDYLVTASPNKSTIQSAGWVFQDKDNDGDPDSATLNNYFFLTVPSSAGYTHVPLYSGANVQTTSVNAGPTWNGANNTSGVVANGVVGGLREVGVEDANNERESEFKPVTFWVSQDSDGDGTNDIRYTWWAEDMEGFPQPDKIGNQYPGGASGNANQLWTTFVNGGQNSTDIHSIGSGIENRAFYDYVRLGYGPYDSRIGVLGDLTDNFRTTTNDARNPTQASTRDARGIKFVEESYSPDGYSNNNWGDPDSRTIPRQAFFIEGVNDTSNPNGAFSYPDGPTPQIATCLSVKEMRITSTFSTQPNTLDNERGTAKHSVRGNRERAMGRTGGILSNASAGIVHPDRAARSSYGLRGYKVVPKIPYGMGYPNQGASKLNLNNYTTSADVNSLDTVMDANLPVGWENRGGGYGGGVSGDYLQALAANMVDYVDNDNNFSGSRSLSPNYRGVDGYPVVNEIYLQVEVGDPVESSVTDPELGSKYFEVEISMTPHLEFWNPTNQITDTTEVDLVWTDENEYMQHFRIVNPLDLASEDSLNNVKTTDAMNYVDLRIIDSDEDLRTNGYLWQVDRTNGLVNTLLFDQASLSLDEARSINLGKNLGVFQPNQYKAFSFDTIVYTIRMRSEIIEEDGSTTNVVPSNLIFLGNRGVALQDDPDTTVDETQGFIEPDGCYSGKYVIRYSSGGIFDKSEGGLYRGGTSNPDRDTSPSDIKTLNLSSFSEIDIGVGNQLFFGNHASHRTIRSGESPTSVAVNPGDPYMSFYISSEMAGFSMTPEEFDQMNSLGGRNFMRVDASLDNNGDANGLARDLTNDIPHAEVWPERWPDGGYNTVRGGGVTHEDLPLGNQSNGEWGEDDIGYTTIDPWGDSSSANDYEQGYDPRTMAPFKLNNTGRWWAISELGNVYDPVMYAAHSNSSWDSYRSIPADTPESAGGGGGNTLRIGRSEHKNFVNSYTFHVIEELASGSTPDASNNPQHAARLLDIFHVGTNGSNVGDLANANSYNPMFHIDPPTSFTRAGAAGWKFNHVWGNDLSAQGLYRYINGHINVNGMHDEFIVEHFCNDIAVMDDGYGMDISSRSDETISWRSSGAARIGSSEFSQALYKHRPYYSQYQMALNLFDQNKADMTDLVYTKQDSSGSARSLINNLPASDAVREEEFARVLNLTTLSSRHFRIHVMGEHLNSAGAPIAASRRVYEIFANPIRDNAGDITDIKIEVLSERELD